MQGDFAAPAASFFLGAQKEAKEAPGGERNRQARLRRPCLHVTHPWTPAYGGRQLGGLGGHRKGAGGSAEWFLFYYRCRGVAGNLWGLFLSVERAPFGAVGLKYGSEGRRAGEGTRPYTDAEALPPIRRGRSQTGPRAATWGRPYEIRGTLRPFRRGRRPRRPAGAHCAPLRRRTDWERWFGMARRQCGTAPLKIFHLTGPL